MNTTLTAKEYLFAARQRCNDPMPALQPAPLLRPSIIECADEVLRWAREYVSQPDPRLGRVGAICPFVPASLKKDIFHVAVHQEVDDTTSAETIEQLLVDYIDVFLQLAPPEDPDRLLKTVLPAFPRMSAQRALVLDEIHARLKTPFVERGVMIGQFHPLCTSPAVRNAEFHNKTSPVPVFALRHIAAHDILFLHSRRDWFEQYRALHGARHETRDADDEHGLVALYCQTAQRFACRPESSRVGAQPEDQLR